MLLVPRGNAAADEYQSEIEAIFAAQTEILQAWPVSAQRAQPLLDELKQCNTTKSQIDRLYSASTKRRHHYLESLFNCQAWCCGKPSNVATGPHADGSNLCHTACLT
jgi:hypothetical protein